MKINELMESINEYKARVSTLKKRFVEIDKEKKELQIQKENALFNGNDEAIDELNAKIEKLETESGNVHQNIQVLEIRGGDHFTQYTEDIKKELEGRFAEVEDEFQDAIEDAFEAKEAYIDSLKRLSNLKNEANKVNHTYREVLQTIEDMKPEDKRKNVDKERVGRLETPRLLPNTYIGEDPSKVVGINEKTLKKYYQSNTEQELSQYANVKHY